MKAVIYARYSSHNQTEQSIEGQLRECNKYANNNDITIVDTYIDRAISGTTDKREQFQKMIKDSDHGFFDAVITYKIDRFARNRYDSAMYKSKLQKNGVKVLYATEHIPDEPIGIMLESLLEGMAEYYSEELSQKIKRGMKESAYKCKALGGPVPLGYKVNSDKKYEIDVEKAPIVKMVFELYDKGFTSHDICTKLNKMGFKTSRGGEFKKNSLWVIFRNKKYIGVYEGAGIVVEDGIPAIVDKDLFERVQKRLGNVGKRPAVKKSNVDYKLSGKIYCAYCGAYMIGESGTSKHHGRKHYYYKCGSRKRNMKCNKKTVRKEWLESVVVNHTVKYVLQPAKVDFIAKKCVELSEKERKDDTELKTLKKQLNDVQKSIDNIMAALEQGIWSGTTKERLEELESAKDKLIFEIDMCSIKHPRLTEDHIIYLLSKFCSPEKVGTDEYTTTIIKTFVNSVHLSNDKMVITYNLTNKKAELESSVLNLLSTHRDIDFNGFCEGSDLIENGGE